MIQESGVKQGTWGMLTAHSGVHFNKQARVVLPVTRTTLLYLR